MYGHIYRNNKGKVLQIGSQVYSAAATGGNCGFGKIVIGITPTTGNTFSIRCAVNTCC